MSNGVNKLKTWKNTHKDIIVIDKEPTWERTYADWLQLSLTYESS